MKIEIKEVGPLERTVYIFEDNSIRTAGVIAKEVYRIRGDFVCEGGFLGKRLYRIKGNDLVEADKLFFPKTLFSFTDDAVYQNGRKIYKLVRVGESSQPKPATTSASTEKPQVKVEVKVQKVETPSQNNEYKTVKAYYAFLTKYEIVRAPEYMQDRMYSKFELSLAGIDDPKKLHIELVQKGFYQPANIKETLSLYKVSDLEMITKALGIKATGKKDEVIERIANNTTLSVVESLLKEKVIRSSAKAKQYFAEHKLEIEYYTLDDINMTLAEYIEKRKTLTKNGIKWQRCLEKLKADIGYGERAYRQMGAILEEENKPRDALLYYLKALYFCVNGVDEYNRGCSSLIDEVTICIGTGMTNPIARLKEHYCTQMMDVIEKIKIPFVAVDMEMFTKMVKEIMDGKYNDLTWERRITANFKKKVKATL